MTGDIKMGLLLILEWRWKDSKILNSHWEENWEDKSQDFEESEGWG